MRDDDFLDAFRHRPRDLDDVQALQPTPDEIVWVEGQLGRLNRVAPHRALRIQLYLEQGTQERPTRATKDER
jgi:hypothetical protein